MIITVQCPSCETAFPVDTDKVPEGGVDARCSVCSDIFRVDSSPAHAPAEAPAPEAPVGVAEVPPAAGEGAEPSGESEEGADFDAAPYAEETPQEEDDEAGLDAGPEDEGADLHAAPYAEETVHEEAAGLEALPDREGTPEIEAEVEPRESSIGWEPETEDAEEELDIHAGWEVEPREEEESELELTATWEDEVDAPAGVEGDSGDGIADSGDVAGLEADAIETEPMETREPGPDIVEGEVEDEPAAEAPEAESRAPTLPEAPPGAEIEVVEPELDDAPDPDEGTVPETVSAPSEPPTGFQFGKRDPHEKAQRLARVLVSDMIMYNPERHGRALDGGTLKEDFEDEIQKSWDEYVEQVGEEIARSTSYFSDALNEILARGEPMFEGHPPD